MVTAPTKQLELERRWMATPLARGKDIASGLCASGTAITYCPLPKYKDSAGKEVSFRVRQVIYALSTDPNLDAKENRISPSTLARARKYLNGGRTLRSYPTPKPTKQAKKTTQAAPTTNAQELTAERGKVYGHPLDNFADVTWGKEVLSKCKDDEVRHALEMIWLKMCRLVHTPDHKDSIDDIAGYAEVIHMIHAERKRRS